jgi:hypothetical protein
MLKVSEPIKNCFLFEFQKQKDLALTFCRVQEYYESNNEELNGKFFSFEEFIKKSMDDDGFINYFSDWDGFNIPGDVWETWRTNVGLLSQHETRLDNEISLLYDNYEKYYIIGTMKNAKGVIDHEIAHALFYLNHDYRVKTSYLNLEFKTQFKTQYNKVLKTFKKMGYNESVFEDEMQAWMSSSKKNELVEDFGLDYDAILPIIKSYRKVLRKYNTR